MKQFFEIVDVTAREIMDLNFQNSLEVEITLDDETVGRAAAPSGMPNARDVSMAVQNVNIEISEALLAMNALDQPSIDRMLLELDGSAGASRLGANALLAVSLCGSFPPKNGKKACCFCRGGGNRRPCDSRSGGCIECGRTRDKIFSSLQ